MPIIPRNDLKDTFENGYIPDENDFCDVFDSFIHKEDDVVSIDPISGNVDIGADLNVGNITATSININGMGMIPQGGIMMWSGNTIPAGWAICDGRRYDTNGNVVSSGGTKTPDLRGRFIVGKTNSINSNYEYTNSEKGRSDYNSIGKFGGEYNVKLQADQSGVPEHKHLNDFTISGGTHSHLINASSNGWGYTGVVSKSVDTDHQVNIYGQDQGEHTHTINNNTEFNTAQAAQNPHENLPPYYVLAFIMKI